VVYIYKFAFRFKSGVFLGYSKPQTPVTNALIFQSGKMIIVRHVNLNESMFPFKQYLIITNALIFNHYLKKKTKR
jgi:TATA-box binding protein (TBP) (component of TFIID and TFIIIB)